MHERAKKTKQGALAPCGVARAKRFARASSILSCGARKVDINPNADVSSLIAKEHKDEHPKVYVIAKDVTKEERKGQYALVVKEPESEEEFSIRFLWERQLSALAREFGGSTEEWIGKKISLSVEKSKSEKTDSNGEPFYNWVLKPYVEDVKA